jgi:hypothetical protein
VNVEMNQGALQQAKAMAAEVSAAAVPDHNTNH